MFGMLKRLEDTFAAQAFAEAWEPEAAMEMAGVTDCGKSVSDMYVAAAFAEAGCHDVALETLGHCAKKRLPPTRQVCGFLESVGLSGVHVAYGLAEA